jgi:hypothetical protein
MKVGEHASKLAPLGMRNDSTPPGSTELQLTVKNVEEEQINDKKISTCAKHFKHIATMTSFKDSYFRKTIRDEIQDNPDNSWKAFMSLSLDSVGLYARPKIISNPFNRETLLQKIGRSS